MKSESEDKKDYKQDQKKKANDLVLLTQIGNRADLNVPADFFICSLPASFRRVDTIRNTAKRRAAAAPIHAIHIMSRAWLPWSVSPAVLSSGIDRNIPEIRILMVRWRMSKSPPVRLANVPRFEIYHGRVMIYARTIPCNHCGLHFLRFLDFHSKPR